MTDQSTIGPAHLYRAAFVYVRQSSLAQVENNTESTRSQFALEAKPCDWDGFVPPSPSSTMI